MNHHPCLLAATMLAAGVADLAAQTWTQLTPTAPPTTRRSLAAAFDLVGGTALFYGGLQTPTAILNETWRFDGAAWTLLTPATTPPPRWGHRMVYDTRRARVVTFGGRSPTTTATANDTWEWDGSNWSQASPTASPPARAFYSMAYDERRGRVVVFGAQTNPVGSQLWEYDGTTWVQAVFANGPLGRDTPALVYDKGRGVTVLFGGWNASAPGTMHNDTWDWDGTTWTQRLTATLPPARYQSAHWYDDARGRVVVYGGYGSAALTDTWEFNGVDWALVATGGPLRSASSAAVFDPLRGTAFHFGGNSAAGASNETWGFVGPTTALFAPYGQGCAGGGGVPEIQGLSLPVLGQVCNTAVVNLPTSAPFTFVAMGFGNTTWPLGSLPYDMSAFGLGGCRLELNPLDFALAIAVGGTANWGFGVPNQPVLAGLQLYLQAYTPDPAAGNGSATLSRAAHTVLGL